MSRGKGFSETRMSGIKGLRGALGVVGYGYHAGFGLCRRTVHLLASLPSIEAGEAWS